jgi:hypothetical protein
LWPIKYPEPAGPVLAIAAPLAVFAIWVESRLCPKENFAVSQLANNPLLMTRAQDISVMLKGAAIAALVLAIASQLDQYFSNGRYTDVTVAMLRQIRHSFGV